VVALDAVDGLNAMAEEGSEKRTALRVAIIGIAGTVLAAVIGAIATATASRLTYLSHQYDIDAKMIELGIGILRAPVTEETKPLREWAIDVMDKRAKFQFNDAQRAVLMNQSLPFDSSYYPSYDSTYTPSYDSSYYPPGVRRWKRGR
jgi:hypothetical protein